MQWKSPTFSTKTITLPISIKFGMPWELWQHICICIWIWNLSSEFINVFWMRCDISTNILFLSFSVCLWPECVVVCIVLNAVQQKFTVVIAVYSLSNFQNAEFRNPNSKYNNNTQRIKRKFGKRKIIWMFAICHIFQFGFNYGVNITLWNMWKPQFRYTIRSQT